MTRESINLSYFDKNKELPIDLHYEMYRNIKNDIYAIASHYQIDFVIAETEVIKKSNEILENLIRYIEDKIKKLKNECASFGHLIDRDTVHKYDLQIKLYEDLLERIKNNKHE